LRGRAANRKVLAFAPETPKIVPSGSGITARVADYMSRMIEISFSRTPKAGSGAGMGLAVLLAPEDGAPGEAAGSIDPAHCVERAIRVAGFKGKALATLDIIAPAESPADRILVVGFGDPRTATEHDWTRLGGDVLTSSR